jgi:hypothetical protein
VTLPAWLTARRVPKGALIALFGSIAVVGGGVGCGGSSARSKACDRVHVAERDYAALRTHNGNPDFTAQVQVYANELDGLALASANAKDARLDRAVQDAKSAFRDSRADLAKGTSAAHQLLLDQRRFAYAMAEALARCRSSG